MKVCQYRLKTRVFTVNIYTVRVLPLQPSFCCLIPLIRRACESNLVRSLMEIKQQAIREGSWVGDHPFKMTAEPRFDGVIG